jgi:hypothetical protein
MPVYIYEEDAFERMAAVEQDERWIEMQNDGRFGDCSFQAFHDEWVRNYEPRQESMSLVQRRAGLSVNGTGAIYGAGGYNRYTVRLDGEIMFLRMLARSEKCVARAEEQGFRVFPVER